MDNIEKLKMEKIDWLIQQLHYYKKLIVAENQAQTAISQNNKHHEKETQTHSFEGQN